ncbi:hypothetical protein HDZ31DRAFT_67869 [Schizophyllum fasciatum]
MYILPHPGQVASGLAPSAPSTFVLTVKSRVRVFARFLLPGNKKKQDARSTVSRDRSSSLASYSSRQTCSTDATLVDDPDSLPRQSSRSSRPPSHLSEPRLSLAQMRAQSPTPSPPPSSFVPPNERRLTLAEMRASWSGPLGTRALSHPPSFELPPTRPHSFALPPPTPARSSISLPRDPPAADVRRQLSISFADEIALVQRGEDAQRRRSLSRSLQAAVAPADGVAVPPAKAAAPSAVPNTVPSRGRKFFIPRPKSWSGKRRGLGSTSAGGGRPSPPRQSSIVPVYIAAVGMFTIHSRA